MKLQVKSCAILIFVACLIGCQSQADISLQMTKEAETSLTGMYGDEVREVIEYNSSQRSNLEVHREPSRLSEFVTGPYLDYLLSFHEDNDSEPYWLVSESDIIESLRVVDYDKERFRAVACLTMTTNEMSTDGALLETYPPRKQCGVYVFANVDGGWKLAGVFNTTNPDYVARDWEYAPSWLKEVIGELPRDPSMLRESR